MTPIGTLEGADVTTIEGATGKVAKAVQRRLDRASTCRSAATASRARSCRPSACCSEIAKPTDQDIDLAMNGNVCRCCTYHRIRAAIHDASNRLEG